MNTVRYTDGTPVTAGDAIRYRQAAGGMLPRGDWRYGVAVTDPNPCYYKGSLIGGELVMSACGWLYNLLGHEIERVTDE